MSDQFKKIARNNNKIFNNYTNVILDNINSFRSTSLEFSRIYLHLSKDMTIGRRVHELQCIQRWFILRDYMKASKLNNVIPVY